MRPARPARISLASPQAVINDHGGDAAFWRGWALGELDPDVQAWVREQAKGNAALRKDLLSIEPSLVGSTKAAHAEVNNALEADRYLADGARLLPLYPGENGEEAITDIALIEGKPPGARSGGPPRKVRHWIGSGLFALLEEVEIALPAADEAAEGSRLLQHLAGPEALTRFRRLHDWLSAVRAQPADRALDRLLRDLAPRLFEKNADGYHCHLSFRLYLRARLQDYCERQGWLPVGPRFYDLTTAFAALSRERIGEVVRCEVEKLERRHQAESVGVSSGEVYTLLQQCA